MSSTVISIVSAKGGVSKSTLARAIAVEAARAGLTVKVGDLDLGQGTVLDWCRLRLANGLEPPVSAEPYRDAKEAKAAAQQHDLLILDAPGHADAATLATARLSDVVIQPTRATRDDLVPGLKLFRKLVAAGIPNTKLAFALTQVSTDSEEQEAREFLTEAGFTVLDGALPFRPIYGQIQNDGHAVTEVRFAALRAKARELVQAIVDRMPD